MCIGWKNLCLVGYNSRELVTVIEYLYQDCQPLGFLITTHSNRQVCCQVTVLIPNRVYISASPSCIDSQTSYFSFMNLPMHPHLIPHSFTLPEIYCRDELLTYRNKATAQCVYTTFTKPLIKRKNYALLILLHKYFTNADNLLEMKNLPAPVPPGIQWEAAEATSPTVNPSTAHHINPALRLYTSRSCND